MNTRQIIFWLALIVPSFKVAMLPSYLANIAGTDMWITVLVPLLLDVGVLGVILFIRNRAYTGNKVFEIAYKIIGVAYAVYFTLTCSVLAEETINYLLQSFFDDADRLRIVLPLILTAVYFGYKGSKSMGRSCEIFIWLFLLGILINAIFNTVNVDFKDLRPVLEGEVDKKILGASKCGLWFGDFLPLLFIKINDKKFRPLPIILSAIGVSLFVGGVFAVFSAQWGEMAKDIPNAFARLAGYGFISADVGKVDWLVIIGWLTACVIKLASLLLGARGGISKAFGEKAGKFTPFVAGAIVIFLQIFVIKTVNQGYNVGTGVGVVGLVFNFAIPIILFGFALFCTKKREKRIEKEEESEEFSQ